jgi:hypothetical protein
MVAEPTGRMLSFEEGQRVGGRVLYEEGPTGLKRRRREATAIAVFFVGSLVWLPPVFLVLALDTLLQDPGDLRWLLGLAIGLPLLALCVAIATWSRRSVRRMTAKRVYEGGYSSGWGERPFYPKSLFYAIDERHGLRRDTPYAVITLVGGFSFSISSGPVRQATTENDYKEMLAAFRQMVGQRDLDPRWTESAWHLTSKASHYRGPLRAVAESLADKEGAAAIDEAFIESKWGDIRKAFLPVRLKAFREFAAMKPGADRLPYAKPADEGAHEPE